MIKLIFFIFLFSFSLFGERISINPSSRSFMMQPPLKERIDVFDFAGEFPQLENIDVNARKKKNVEFYLTGDFPILKNVNYEGSFGTLKGKLTGNFPELCLINFICTNCAMDFDLKADWKLSCEINIRGADQDIILDLPKNVGILVHTRTGLKGKVIVCEDFKKKKWYSVLNKTFENSLLETAPVVLTINIAAGDGQIILN